MNIYVGHSKNFDFEKELYEPLRTISAHSFIFPHEQGRDFFSSKELFTNKTCDLFLAEVTLPATGLGIELGWANDAGINIVCLHKSGSHPSRSIKYVSNQIVEYTDAADLIAKIKTLFPA